MTKKLNFISLFSGGGGFQIGFENAGYNCLLSSEIDMHARKNLCSKISKINIK